MNPDNTMDFNGMEVDLSLFDDDCKSDYLSIPDAYVTCLRNKGRFDLSYVKSLTGCGEPEILQTLDDVIIQDPEKANGQLYRGFISREEYLSGDILHKYEEAIRANKLEPKRYSTNIEVLRNLLPAKPDIHSIYFRLGTSWIPAIVYWKFASQLFGFPSYWNNEWSMSPAKSTENTYVTSYHYGISFDPEKGLWDFLSKESITNEVNYSRRQYRTSRCTATHLFLSAMNGKTITVTDKIKNGKGKKDTRIVNERETTLANEIIARFKAEFIKYVYSHEDIAKLIVDTYYQKFCAYRRREYDGSYLTLPNINPCYPLRDYQKNGIAQIIASPNTLLAHDVGYGKTFTMIAAVMELRRLGFSKKNLITVPTSTMPGWKQQFQQLYPTSNVCFLYPKDFTPKNKQDTLKRIATEDYDAFVMPHSCFTSIKISKDYRTAPLRHEREVLVNDRLQATSYSDQDRLDRAIKKKEEEIQKIMDEPESGELTFDQLKINTLFVDEAQYFKNISLDGVSFMRGVNSVGSAQADDMMFKTNIVQSQNDGRGVVFATATPLVNSIAEVYVLEKYLHPGTLKTLKLESFNAWISTFAEVSPEFEVDTVGNNFRVVNRLRKFHNLPQLSALLSTFTSFAYNVMDDELPTLGGFCEEKLTKGDVLAAYVHNLETRTDQIKNRQVHRKQDNMLAVTIDGRMAALDTRLVNQPEDTNRYKLLACVDNVTTIYQADPLKLDTQIIFCDLSTPKKDWNVYDELKHQLILKGVDPRDIAFVHEATTEKQRETLFEKMNESKIRILIGSTWKCGLGVNIQKHLKAVHHLDIPWRPADIIQREGRMLRQGNLSDNVLVYRYVVKGTFDAYSWQILETKEKFIEELLSGVLNQSDGDDIGQRALSYGEVKALAIGNPLIRERVETVNQLQHLKMVQAKVMSANLATNSRKLELPGLIQTAHKKAKEIESDYNYYKQFLGETLSDSDKAELETLEAKFAQARSVVTGNVLRNCDFSQRPLKGRDLRIGSYHGFDIMVYSTSLSSFYLKRRSTYTLEWKDSGNVSNMRRFFGFLERMSQSAYNKVNKLTNELQSLESFASLEDHQKDINDLERKLESLDYQLKLENMKGDTI